MIVATLLKGIISVEPETKPHSVPVTVDFNTSPNAPGLLLLSLKAPVTYRLPAIVRVVPPGLAFCVNIESTSVVDVKPVIGSVTSKNNGTVRFVPFTLSIINLAKSLILKFFVGFLSVASFSVPNSISSRAGSTVL